MTLLFSYGNLSYEEVRQFLLETDNEFPTPLSEHVDIDAYARKLSLFSDFAVCRDQDHIIGMISCYTNRPPLGYISNVCVKKQYQRRKVFSRLFCHLLTNMKDREITRLLLEVAADNDNAHSVYEHIGFRELEIRSDTGKSLMELNLG